MEIRLNDLGIVQEETKDGHVYHLGELKMRGITSTLVDWAFPDTYIGAPDGYLDTAIQRGKRIHSCIEMVSLMGVTPGVPEVQRYIELMDERGLEAIANEYIVTDMTDFASPIDIVAADKEDNIFLIDIKTTSAEYKDKTSLQLNIYKAFFEWQNPHLKVAGLLELWLPKPKDGKEKSKMIDLQMVDNGVIELMLDDYKSGKSPDRTLESFKQAVVLPPEYDKALATIAQLERQAQAIKAEQEKMKQSLLVAFRENGYKKFENDDMTITYVPASKRVSVDNRLLKEGYPEVWAACKKESEVKDSIRIKIKTS